jgi:hypothetical protein
MYLDNPMGKTVAEVMEFLSKDKTVNMMILKSIEDYDQDIVRYQRGCERVKETVISIMTPTKKRQPPAKMKHEVVKPIVTPAEKQGELIPAEANED